MLIRGQLYAQIKKESYGHHEGSSETEKGCELEVFCRDVNKVTEIRQVLLGRLEVFMRSLKQDMNVRKALQRYK